MYMGNYQKKGVFEEMKMCLEKVVYSKLFQLKFMAYG